MKPRELLFSLFGGVAVYVACAGCKEPSKEKTGIDQAAQTVSTQLTSQPSATLLAPSTSSTHLTNNSETSEDRKEREERDRLMVSNTIEDALKVVAPYIKDSHTEKSRGSIDFLLWATSKMRLSDLQNRPATSYDAALKDSAKEKGKTLCVNGITVSPSAEKMAGKKYSAGMIVNERKESVWFWAVGEAPTPSEGAKVKFCGVALQKYSYPNTKNETQTTLLAVGMFDAK